jgi:serine/threonine protein kinase
MKRKLFESAFSKYFDHGIIGQGGSGQVYKVKDESGDQYAVKVLNPVKAKGEKLRRFKNEIIFSQKNPHKNIIHIIDHGLYKVDNNASPFYVMPFYACSFRKLLTEGMELSKILHFFAQILDGVEVAHLKGVFHRDLKPENILFNPALNILVVADFGIAHFGEDELFTLVETGLDDRLANFQYAAPEQRKRGQKVDHRADIFALGLMLNEMFTGEVPHGTGFKSIESVAPDYSYLDGLVIDMIRQSPEERPASIEIIKQQLKARGHEFVEFQKLSQLKQTVVPVSEIDDQLINDPPRLIAADWDGRTLTLTLSQPINPKWNWALCNMPGYSSVMSKGPEMFRFSGNRATIDAAERQVQDIINSFKSWLPVATRKYEETIRKERREEEERERERLKRQIEEQERILRVRKTIQI